MVHEHCGILRVVECADNLEAEIRRNFDKLMTGQSRVAAKAAGRAVDVSADDFEG